MPRSRTVWCAHTALTILGCFTLPLLTSAQSETTCKAAACQESINDVLDGRRVQAVGPSKEETENVNDPDLVLQMQTRVFLNPPVAEKTEHQKHDGKNLIDQEEAQQKTEAILREGLREAVDDLRGEWQQRLDELNQRAKMQHETIQEVSDRPVAEITNAFQGLGGSPPGLLQMSRSKVLGSVFMQKLSHVDPMAPVYVAAMVLGFVVVGFFLRRLLIAWEMKEQRAQVDAQSASAKLQQLLGALGFDQSCGEEDDSVQLVEEMYPKHMPVDSITSDSEEEPEAESTVETAVKAISSRVKMAAEMDDEKVPKENGSAPPNSS